MTMTVHVLRQGYVHETVPSNRKNSPDRQHALQALIDTLIDIDLEHERQREDLSKGTLDPASKHRMLKKLGEQHRQRREPYVQQYIVRQQQSGRKGSFPDPSTSGSSPLRG
jgi:hypothetical protein